MLGALVWRGRPHPGPPRNATTRLRHVPLRRAPRSLCSKKELSRKAWRPCLALCRQPQTGGLTADNVRDDEPRCTAAGSSGQTKDAQDMETTLYADSRWPHSVRCTSSGCETALCIKRAHHQAVDGSAWSSGRWQRRVLVHWARAARQGRPARDWALGHLLPGRLHNRVSVQRHALCRCWQVPSRQAPAVCLRQEPHILCVDASHMYGPIQISTDPRILLKTNLRSLHEIKRPGGGGSWQGGR